MLTVYLRLYRMVFLAGNPARCAPMCDRHEDGANEIGDHEHKRYVLSGGEEEKSWRRLQTMPPYHGALTKYTYSAIDPLEMN